MSDHIFNDSVRQTLGQLAKNRILREQYLDFLKFRRFRQTLLCRGDAPVKIEPRTESVERFFVASTTECTTDPAEELTSNQRVFESPKGATVETDYALGQSALVVLRELWPRPLSFKELLRQATARLGEPDMGKSEDRIVRGRLSEFPLRLYDAGTVTFRTEMPCFTSTISERPSTSPVVRWQAQHGEFVTSTFHVAVKVEDEIGRQLLTWLDGNHDRNALVERLVEFLRSRSPAALSAGLDPEPRRKIESELAKNLAKLARFGLLVS